MKKLCIYGVRYCDIVLYIARILANMNFKVLVCDRSITKAVRYYLPVPDEIDLGRDAFEFCGFGYTYSARYMQQGAGTHAGICTGDGYEDNAMAAEMPQSPFDYVIELCDASAAACDFWDEALNERTIRLFITDELPDNVSAMKSAIRAMNKASGAIKELYDGERKETDRCGYFVVRDYSGKVTKVMDELILEAGAAKNFLIPYSSKDRHLEILAACNEGFRFAGASERLLCLIESLCGDLGVRKPESRFKSAYSAAEKGKTLYTADHQIRYLPPRARNAKKYRQLS